MIAAFEGWNDAGRRRLRGHQHLEEVCDAVRSPSSTPRTTTTSRSTGRRCRWPTTGSAHHLAHDPDLPGEPARRAATWCWSAASSRACAGARSSASCSAWRRARRGDRRDPRRAARRHPAHPSGPGHAARTSTPGCAQTLALEPSRYEGPTGHRRRADRRDHAGRAWAVSFWAAVPHYVAQPPCPKATLALLRELEDLLDLAVPRGDLPRRRGPGSAGSTSSPRRTRRSPSTSARSRRRATPQTCPRRPARRSPGSSSATCADARTAPAASADDLSVAAATSALAHQPATAADGRACQPPGRCRGARRPPVRHVRGVWVVSVSPLDLDAHASTARRARGASRSSDSAARTDSTSGSAGVPPLLTRPPASGEPVLRRREVVVGPLPVGR